MMWPWFSSSTQISCSSLFLSNRTDEFFIPMAESTECFHVTQQTRREKLRSVALVTNVHGCVHSIDSMFDSSDFVPYSIANGQAFDGRTVSESLTSLTQHCKSTPGFVMGLDGENRNTCSPSLPRLHYPPVPLHNHTSADRSFNGDGEVMPFKPENLSLSLSSLRNRRTESSLYVDLQKYGSGSYGSGINDESRSSLSLASTPCTGYSIILKGSRFLKPAQLLLEEFCEVLGRTGRIHAETLMADSSLMDPCLGNFHGSFDASECSKNRSTVILILEEVYRRYKHYYSQMQEVVTSFEYIVGLGGAAPFVSFAMKTMSMHFSDLKDLITDHLRFTSKASVHNNSRTVSNPGFFDDHRPVWRPQRGLPDRAVSVLRSWLFDHFLHPYPTDSDKNMLAEQTGLSRNQASNWFINARVRLWKPLVEEIYSLESKQPPNSSKAAAAERLLKDFQASTRTNSIAEDSKQVKKIPSIRKPQNHVWSSPSSSNIGAGRADSTIGGPGSVSLTLGLHQNNGQLGLSESSFPISGRLSVVHHHLEANREKGWR